MKKHQPKSFTFKLAQKTAKKSQWKARNGVAVAGCTLTQFPWGREPTTNFAFGGDGPVYC